MNDNNFVIQLNSNIVTQKYRPIINGSSPTSPKPNAYGKQTDCIDGTYEFTLSASVVTTEITSIHCLGQA